MRSKLNKIYVYITILVLSFNSIVHAQTLAGQSSAGQGNKSNANLNAKPDLYQITSKIIKERDKENGPFLSDKEIYNSTFEMCSQNSLELIEKVTHTQNPSSNTVHLNPSPAFLAMLVRLYKKANDFTQVEDGTAFKESAAVINLRNDKAYLEALERCYPGKIEKALVDYNKILLSMDRMARFWVGTKFAATLLAFGGAVGFIEKYVSKKLAIAIGLLGLGAMGYDIAVTKPKEAKQEVEAIKQVKNECAKEHLDFENGDCLVKNLEGSAESMEQSNLENEKNLLEMAQAQKQVLLEKQKSTKDLKKKAIIADLLKQQDQLIEKIQNQLNELLNEHAKRQK